MASYSFIDDKDEEWKNLMIFNFLAPEGLKGPDNKYH